MLHFPFDIKRRAILRSIYISLWHLCWDLSPFRRLCSLRVEGGSLVFFLDTKEYKIGDYNLLQVHEQPQASTSVFGYDFNAFLRKLEIQELFVFIVAFNRLVSLVDPHQFGHKFVLLSAYDVESDIQRRH